MIWTNVTDPFGVKRIAEWRGTDPAGAAQLVAERRSLLQEAATAVATISDGALRGLLQSALAPVADALEHAAAGL